MPSLPDFIAKAPSAMLGTILTRWTIRLALACLTVYFGGRLLGIAPAGAERNRRGGKKFALLRWIWTAGCVLFIAHVACAFHFTHEWSHARAWEHTARETERLMGFSFGNGIYFSYLFLIVWVADVVSLWVCDSRPWWFILPTYLFIFFIALNGAIVFEDGPTRPAGVMVVAGLALLAIGFVARQIRRQPGQERNGALAEADA
jgi:hypothetical protein